MPSPQDDKAAICACPRPGAGDRTPVQDVRQSDLLVALASGQNGREGPTMAFGPQVDLG
jgi:hypothetical protein